MNHDVNSHSKSRADEIMGYAGKRPEFKRGSEINRLSGEFNQRITQETNDLMSSASIQIQGAINETINEQVLPQIQATLRSGPGRAPDRWWKNPVIRSQCRSEEVLNRKSRRSSTDEVPRDYDRNEDLENPFYTIRNVS